MPRKILLAGSVLAGVIAILWFLPLPASLNSDAVTSISITDRDGALLYNIQRGGLRTDQSQSKIPQVLIDSLIATEDRTFYSHHGLSARGIARAIVRDVQAMRIVEGGSTITQQYVRTKLQPKRRSIFYKCREAWLALKVDARMTKHEILQDFLSSVYFGSQAYGIGAAADTYFAKSVSNLSLSESALLIGLINAPSSLNPFRNRSGAIARRDLVLRALHDQKKISDEEYTDAIREPPQLSHGRTKIEAPHFVQWVLGNLDERAQKQPRSAVFVPPSGATSARESALPERDAAGVSGNQSIRTTLDLDLQHDAERIVDYQLAKVKDKNVTSAAVVVLDAKNGDILTMVGSADYFDDEHDGQVNVAVNARQPGSTLKPFTYALGFAQGMTAATTLADVETQYMTQEGNPYIPRNYDYDYHGLVRVREALANSYNIPAVKVLERVGIDRLLAFLRAVGISTLNESAQHYGLALTLGSGDVSLLELTAAYGVFARGGWTLVPRALLSDPIVEGSRLLDDRVVWLIADILSDHRARLQEFGNDGPLNFDFPVAAKTGTTRNSRDNWVVGFTTERIVGVWVGNADNTPMKGTSGVTGAGPIFHDVMERAMEGMPNQAFRQPSGMVTTEICSLSGKLSTELCPERMQEVFIAGTEPLERDDVYRSYAIDTRSNLLASDECPTASVERRVFTVFPVELQAWAREHKFPLPPSDFSLLCPGRSQDSAVIDTLEITSPNVDASFLLDPLVPDDSERIFLEARASSTVTEVMWSIDGVVVGTGSGPDFRLKWNPTIGQHTVEARSGNLVSSRSFDVRQQ